MSGVVDEVLIEGTAATSSPQSARKPSTTKEVEFEKMRMTANQDLAAVESRVDSPASVDADKDKKIDMILELLLKQQSEIDFLKKQNKSIEYESKKQLAAAALRSHIESESEYESKKKGVSSTEYVSKSKREEADEEDKEREKLGLPPKGAAEDSCSAGSSPSLYAMFMELESMNEFSFTDMGAYCNDVAKRTTDNFTNFLWQKKHDQAGTLEKLESIYELRLAGKAYENKAQEYKAELCHLGQPAEYTKLLMALRTMHFSKDKTTQAVAADMLQAYVTTAPEKMHQLREHDIVKLHGSPPSSSLKGATEIRGTAGEEKLSARTNPKYYVEVLEDLYCLTVKCCSRVASATSAVTAADQEYEDVQPEDTITKTIVAHELAWKNLCLAYGNTHPRTHKQRISALLKIIEAQQGHSHSTKKYLQQLQRTGQTHTSVEYNVAIGIIRVVAQEVDELAALMDEYTTPDAKTSDGDSANGGKSGQDVAVKMVIVPGNCKICNRPGHKARDCLDFMTRSGVCRFWFMNHIGKNEEGCRKGKDCPRKHERPEEEPIEEKVVGVRAKCDTG